ncbi:MAG: alpha/beta hydrolase [Blastochloris viridis]|uniref:Alpha/beta hydrolase n=1 Tax=Blastochloris viridis TaxID=1079 RepID=A0A6N4R0J9_BLAVI|nr:MAG: alpha/beta hydrolase [Blastochloris viridis]
MASRTTYRNRIHNDCLSAMPQSTRFEHNAATLRAEPLTEAAGPIRLVWLHGWGQSREALRPLAESLSVLGESWILDLPGHGEAPNPPEPYDPAKYAKLVAAWLMTQPVCPTVILGHSLGFRVAVHMAHQRTQSLMGLVSLAGAGVPRALSAKEKSRRRLIRGAMKLAKLLKPVLGEGLLNTLRQKFGSSDYKNVSEGLRPTFIAVVNDNVTSIAPSVTLPTLLIYGDADTETPPSVGQKFLSLLPQAQLKILPHQTHYTVLAGGRHVVAPLVRDFISTLER